MLIKTDGAFTNYKHKLLYEEKNPIEIVTNLFVLFLIKIYIILKQCFKKW